MTDGILESMDSQTEPPVSRKSVYLSAQKVSIAAVVAFLFLLFGAIVVFANRYGSGTPMPSPSGQPDGLFQAGEASALQAQQQPQVKGAQVPPKPQNYNVPQPSKAPSPTPKTSATAAPSSTPAPSPTPSPTPTPTPTPAPNNPDNTGPEIKEIQSSGVEDTKATISWKTNEDAEGKLEYGKTTSYGDTKDLTEKKTTQSIEISGLEANTTYHFRIVGKDGSGNSTTSGDNQFTTKPAP